MADVLISPGVLARENDLSFIQNQPIEAGTAIIGPTVKGPEERPTLVTSYSEYLNTFGSTFESGSNQYTFLTSIAAYNYFQQGGTTLLVTRVTSGSFGPAESTTIDSTAFTAYGAIALIQGQIFIARFSFTVVGALFGFLWFNVYPADLFMGDTGSLSLGATLAVIALMTGQWGVLPLIVIIPVSEVLSVLLQVSYFKLTRGRRVFKMAPFHYHFELLGWSEPQVVQRFWLMSLLFAIFGIAFAVV